MTLLSLQDALQNTFFQKAEHLLFHHSNPWELDEALVSWGYAIGPCEAQDLLGLEKILAAEPNRKAPILTRMVAEGRQGKVAGVGYYRYPGGGGAVIDPLIEDLILEEAWFGKITRHEWSDAALVAAMNESIREVVSRYDPTRAELASGLQALHFPASRIADLIEPQ